MKPLILDDLFFDDYARRVMERDYLNDTSRRRVLPPAHGGLPPPVSPNSGRGLFARVTPFGWAFVLALFLWVLVLAGCVAFGAGFAAGQGNGPL